MSPGARTPDEISTEIADTRNRLAGTIDQLVYRAKPQTIVSRQLASIKASFFAEDGSLDKVRVATVAGVALGAVAVIVGIRRVVG